MKISLRLLLEGKQRTLADDLQVEYRLSQRCVEDKDFHEGVRAGERNRKGSISFKFSETQTKQNLIIKPDLFISSLVYKSK